MICTSEIAGQIPAFRTSVHKCYSSVLAKIGQLFCSQSGVPFIVHDYWSLWEWVNSSHFVFHDSCFLSNLKLALAYNEALKCGKLTWAKGGIIQSTSLESIRKHIGEIQERYPKLKGDLYNYLNLREVAKWRKCGLHASYLVSSMV